MRQFPISLTEIPLLVWCTWNRSSSLVAVMSKGQCCDLENFSRIFLSRDQPLQYLYVEHAEVANQTKIYVITNNSGKSHKCLDTGIRVTSYSILSVWSLQLYIFSETTKLLFN